MFSKLEEMPKISQNGFLPALRGCLKHFEMLRICNKYGTETHAMKKWSRLKENRENLQGSKYYYIRQEV
jgi:hypothetical protein